MICESCLRETEGDEIEWDGLCQECYEREYSVSWWDMVNAFGLEQEMELGHA